MSWDVLDQNGAQINHDADIVLGTLMGEMTDRGSLGDCGHPTSFKITKLHGTNILETAVEIEKIGRVGWNQAGTSNDTAPDIGSGGSWCGSSNRWADCDPHHTWSASLARYDTLLISVHFTPRPECSSVRLAIYDQADQHVQTLFTEYVCDPEEIHHTYVHQGDSGTHYIKLGGVPGGGGDLWAYGIAFELRGTLSGLHRNGLPGLPRLEVRSPLGANGTDVLYTLSRSSASVRLEVFDLKGKRIRVLHRGSRVAGEHRLSWDHLNSAGNLVASGVYLLRLQADDESVCIKTSVLR
jgi:hypothetical protein